MHCPNCGADSPSGARFCWSCGHSLLQRLDERRVVTVLFGDIVGFTALSETMDPEGVKAVVDHCFARLAADIVSFGGHVDKVIGDAIVALFGATVSHEDDAERAVRAALKMQQTIRSLDGELGRQVRMRIGVNTGEALVGTISADRDVTAMGDAVNTAQRLQSAAEPGTVLVGRSTYEATSSAVRYRRVEPIAAKGKELPVEAFLAVEPYGLPGERLVARPQVPLVGREPEMRVLRDAIAASFRRRRSLLVTVVGDAGVGKTRLVQELLREVQAEGSDVVVMSGRCVPYGEANVWWPIAEALRAAIGLDADAPPAVAADVVRKAVADAYRIEPEAAPVERGAIGLLHLLDEDTPLRAADAASASSEAGRAVRTFLQANANQRPLVLWLADLHWADEVVLRMVTGLVTRLARLPFVLVATARYNLHERWTPEPGRYNAITVGIDALEPDACAELLRHLVGGEVSPELADDLIRRSGGNPFFLEELAALVRDGQVTSADALHLPGSVRGVVSSRLDALPAEERELLEDAAVLGRRGHVDGLARISAEMRGRDDVSGVLVALADKDLLLLDRTERREWAFRSDVVRDVVYGRLTKSDRARRHAGIAIWLAEHDENAVDTIAFHFRRAAELVAEIGAVSGTPADLRERAVEWLQRAARADHATPDIAHRLYSQALTLLDGHDPAARAELLLDRARAGIDIRQLTTASRDVDDALHLLDGSAGLLEARAALLLGEIDQRLGAYESAISHLHTAAARYHALGVVEGVAESLRTEGLTYLLAGRMADAEQVTRRALDLFAQAGNRLGEAWARQNLAWLAFATGDRRAAEERIAAASAVFEEIGDQAGLSWTRGLLAFVRMHEGRHAEADALAAQAMRDARERGDRWGEAMMLVLRSSVLLWSGRIEAAVRRSEEAVVLMRAIADPAGEQQAAGVHGRALVLAGRVTDGFAVFREAYDRRLGVDSGVSLYVSTAAAAAAVTLGDPDEAQRWLAGTDLALLDPSTIGHADRLVALGLAELQGGEVERAEAVLHRAVPDGGTETAGAYTLAALALAAAVRGDTDAAHACVSSIDASTAATYADRMLGALAAACACARSHDALGARRALDRAVHGAQETDDRVAPMIVTFAAAAVARRLGPPGADTIERRAGEMAAALGTEASGWSRLFALAAGNA